MVELEDVKDAVDGEGLEELNAIIAPLQQQILTAVTSFQELEQLSGVCGAMNVNPLLTTYVWAGL